MVADGTVKFEMLVPVMGTYLTNAKAELRTQALTLLAKLLESERVFYKTATSSRPLAAPFVAHFLSFFKDRLADRDAIVGATRSLAALFQREVYRSLLPLGEAVSTLKALFSAVHIPGEVQQRRQACCELMHAIICDRRFQNDLLHDYLESKKVSTAKSTNPPVSIPKAFSAAMEGEKDPRCLVKFLKLAKALLAVKPAPDAGMGEVDPAGNKKPCTVQHIFVSAYSAPIYHILWPPT